MHSKYMNICYQKNTLTMQCHMYENMRGSRREEDFTL